MRCKMDCWGLTDIGRVRANNEDQFLIADLNKSLLVHQTSLTQDDHTRLYGGSQGSLLVVADGMGGHAAGQQASSLAVQTLEYYVLNTMPWFFHLPDCDTSDLGEELKSALEACHRTITHAASNRPEQRGMGTTLTMAYILWPRLYVVHVGDSRCYLLRPPKLERITRDQTMAQQLVEHGVLKPEEAPASRWSHVLYSCLGGDSSKEPAAEVYKANLAVGDTLLLCTDGLTTRLSDNQLVSLLHQGSRAEETCQQLVAAANSAGGQDNITVVVARFLDAGQHAAMAQRAEAAAPARANGSASPKPAMAEVAGTP